jgi:hypothetical protein
MDNEKAWGTYVCYTRDITEFLRKLAFAGIAICWIIKPEYGGFPSVTLAGIGLIVLYFIFDILQYCLGAILWRNWIRAQEKKYLKENNSLEGDYSPPDDLDHPVFYAFWIKIFLLFLGFIAIGFEILGRFG